MTPLEGRSLVRGGILLLVLAVFRSGVDFLMHHDPVLVEQHTNLPRLLEESLDARKENERRTLPFGPGETLDPNRSGEEELDRLPGIGPATAHAWVATREEDGGFWNAGDLLGVPGVGPATLEKIRPFLDFSGGVPLDLRDRMRERTTQAISGNGGPTLPTGSTSSPSMRTESRIDLNRAAPEELMSLPGIGPALAARIVESRRREGLFLTLEDLLRVRGIGPATLERIKELVLPRG